MRTIASWHRVSLAALTALALAAAPVRTALGQAEATDYTEFGLAELMEMDTVYGASRYEQKTSDAPAAVTVITGEEIRAYGHRTLGAVLNSVRGFFTTYDRSYEYIGVRGFGRPGDYNTRVLVMYDGHSDNDIAYNASAIGEELVIDMDAVKRIEIIRGPGSSLYGTGAFFAVVNIVTVDGEELAGAELTGEAASFGRFGGRVAWGGLVAGGNLTVSGGFVDTEGQDLYWPEYDDPATNAGVFEDGDGERSGRVHVNYRRGGLTVAGGWVERKKSIPTGEWETIFNDNASFTSDSRFFADAGYRFRVGPKAEVDVRLGYDRSYYWGEYAYDYADAGDPVWRVLTGDLSDGRWLTGGARVTANWWPRHRLVVGGDFRKALMTRQAVWDQDPHWSYLDRDDPIDNGGLFVQDDVDLGRGFSLIAGVRLDAYESFGTSASPRLGLIARPDGDTSLKLLYGEAFRAPNAYELYYGDGYTQKGNPDLQPETIGTWEFVVERRVTPRVAANASIFHNRIHDLIDQTVDPADSLIAFANLGQAETTGAEFEVDARMLAGVRGRLSYSYQHTENTQDGSHLSNSPRHMVKLNVMTPRLASTAVLGLEMLHMSRRATLADGEVDPYLVTNLTLQLEPGPKGLLLTGTAYNLFDADYADPGAEHQVQDALRRDGRHFRVRLGYHW